MRIYLLRHAEAVERSSTLPDELRHLTAQGRKQAAKQGRRFKKLKLRPQLIITSPLVRALQTAELVAGHLSRNTLVLADTRLAPDGSPHAVIDLLQAHCHLKRLMLVGHEPQLSQLAALLLGYAPLPSLQKAGCLALSWNLLHNFTLARFEWYAPRGKKAITSHRALRDLAS